MAPESARETGLPAPAGRLMDRHAEIIDLAKEAAKRAGYPKDQIFMVGYLASRVESLELLLAHAEKEIDELRRERRR